MPPALPTKTWPEAGAVFGTIAACVYASLVTLERPTCDLVTLCGLLVLPTCEESELAVESAVAPCAAVA